MPLFRRFGRPGLLGLAARTAVVAGTASAVSGAVVTHQRRRAQEEIDAQQYEETVARAQTAGPATAAIDTDLVAELQRLAALHESGALSADEFAAAKARLLG